MLSLDISNSQILHKFSYFVALIIFIGHSIFLKNCYPWSVSMWKGQFEKQVTIWKHIYVGNTHSHTHLHLNTQFENSEEPMIVNFYFWLLLSYFGQLSLSLFCFCFLSGFSFTTTDNSQETKRREGTLFNFTLSLPPAHKHSDIYLQLCTWDGHHIFTTLSNYYLIDWWCNVDFCLLVVLILGFDFRFWLNSIQQHFLWLL